MTLDELLAQSDFITIHMPKTPETVGMLGADAFKKMKSTAYVVNVARGGLVDEEALYTALQDGEIAGAGVDVFAKEPSTDLPFFKLDNVVVTPHWAPPPTKPGEGRRLGSEVRPPRTWPANWFPTPSTSPAASSPRTSARASR